MNALKIIVLSWLGLKILMYLFSELLYNLSIRKYKLLVDYSEEMYKSGESDEHFLITEDSLSNLKDGIIKFDNIIVKVLIPIAGFVDFLVINRTLQVSIKCMNTCINELNDRLEYRDRLKRCAEFMIKSLSDEDINEIKNGDITKIKMFISHYADNAINSDGLSDEEHERIINKLSEEIKKMF